MNSISTRSKKFAFLAVAAIALAACGGSSENSNTASTVALGVKNAALSCAAGGACRVGDTGPGGGKVFYVAPASFTSTGSACGTACKYLEAAPIGWIKAATPAGQTNCAVAGTSTADPYCAWSGNTTTRIGTTSNAIGAGYANTSAIIAQSNVAGRAATVARAFQGGGKTDWFLPSKDELTQVYLQKSVLGGFDFNYYWSSSEGAADLTWFQGFDGFGEKSVKSATLYVRPVRAFSDSATVAAPVTTSTSTTTTTVAAIALTCAAGGACRVGDTGPGGGKVFFVATTTFTSGAPCGTQCRYLEAAPAGWTGSTPLLSPNCVKDRNPTVDPRCKWWSIWRSRSITGASGQQIGAGYANTLAIVTQTNLAGDAATVVRALNAATVARAFQGGGKTDWYLPSKSELYVMYLNKEVIGGASVDWTDRYWSSTEYLADEAWVKFFGDPNEVPSRWDQGPTGELREEKFLNNYVRPVRAF